MIKLSLAMASFEDFDTPARLGGRLAQIRSWGYDAVEPMICRPRDIDVDGTLALLDRHELAVSGFRTGSGYVVDRLSLSDPDPGVRTAALAACKDLHLDSLQDQAIGWLQDAEPAVRGAAAAYVSAYPTAEAAEPLRIALQGEQDSGARRKIGRAIKACQKLYENPYGAS